MQPLSRVLDRLQDPNQIQLDLMVDAGLANIAQFVSDYGDDKSSDPVNHRKYNSDMYPFIERDNGTEMPWTYEGDAIPRSWYAVM